MQLSSEFREDFWRVLYLPRALHLATKIREGAVNFLNLRFFLFDYFANSFFNIFCTKATFGDFGCVFDVSPRLLGLYVGLKQF